MQPLPVYVSAKFHIDIIVSKISYLASFIPRRFFDYTTTFENTFMTLDVQYEHGSMSTLMKLFRKNRILTSVHLSQIVLSAVTSVFLTLSGSNLVGRCNRSPYTSLQNFISIYFIVNKISYLASFIYGAITVWPMRGFSTNISRLLHHHIRKHANIMTLDAVDTEYVSTVRCPH